MRQVMKALAVAFLLATLAPNAAHAEFLFVEVVRAGATWGPNVFVWLRNATFATTDNVKVFQVHDTAENQVLATALTAISLDATVQVSVNVSTGRLFAMYLIK